MNSLGQRCAGRWSKWRILGLVIAASAALNIIWTSWVVVTDYEWMGDHQVRTFVLPASPIFAPPRPEDFGEKSWRAFQFFYIGGGGGPIGEPHLRPNWELMALKSLAIVAFGFPVTLFAFRLLGLSRKSPKPKARLDNPLPRSESEIES